MPPVFKERVNRGIRAFERLNNNEESRFTVNMDTCKGRDVVLLASRNLLLLYRLYYYSKLHKKSYVDTMTILGYEFFLSPRTVANMIGAKSETLTKVFKEKLTVKDLQKKYDYLTWKERVKE